MTAAEQADLEFRSIRAAFGTLRKLGYTWEGGQFWVPSPETETEEAVREKPGWYEVWQVRNGKKRSMDSYALVSSRSHEVFRYFMLEGSERRAKPEPFGDQTLGFVKCKPPFKELT